jgi:hypothetical protein
MGALEIRNKKLRCSQCLDIRRLLIVPGYPDPKIEIMCHCNKSVESFLDYCSELKKIQNFKLICSKCGKEEIKHPRFCYECMAVYCSKCCNSHTPRITGNEESNKSSSITGHKTIHVEKLDFYCINHQTENYMAYCQQCLMNICNQCLKEGTHKFHSVELYSVIQLDKKSKENVKKGIKKIEKKIEKNNNLIKKFIKKNKKCEGIKEIEEEFKVISEENDNILDLISKCYELYDHSKVKNYSIIYNLIKNSKFNLKTLKFEKKETTEEKIEHLSKYLKKDFYVLYKRSKTNVEEFEVDNDENNQEEEEEDDDEYNNPMSTMRSSSFHKSSIKMSNEILDKKEEEQTNNINVINAEDENDVKRIETAPKTVFTAEQQVNAQNIARPNNNIASQPPKNEIKKIKMPDIFNPQAQKRPSAIIAPPPKKLKMPLMFEKKEEDNKPKERAAIIKTGASGGLGNKKDFLSQMLNKQGMAGKPKGAAVPPESVQPEEEKIEIIHESNEAGTTEEVLNKVAVTNTKKKKPRRAKFVIEGEENQEPVKKEETKPPEPSTSQVPDNNNVQDSNAQVPQEQTVAPEIKEENKENEVQEEHQEQQQNENEINS